MNAYNFEESKISPYITEIFPKNISLNKKIQFFSSLPYTEHPFSKRNWGHNLHTLCSYQSKLKASMAYYLVQTFSLQKQKILDPFSGVGTIPFECCLNGRYGYGLDINPVAYHTTFAKVCRPAKNEVLKMVEKLGRYITTSKLTSKDVDDYTKNFYHKKTLDEILLARNFFNKNFEKFSKTPAFSFLLSCMLHILHGNRPYALSRRSHNLTPLAPRGPAIYKSVIDHVINKINISYKDPIPQRYLKGDTKIGSVFNIPYSKEHFDAIITSPPFWSSTRFYANNRIRLWFCGWDYHTQEKRGRSEFVEERQIQDTSIYFDIFSQFYRVLKQDGICVLHLGVIPGMDIGKTITPLAKKAGFKFIDLVYENTENIERHGMKDQGITKNQQFLILKKS